MICFPWIGLLQRVLYAYLTDKPPETCPDILFPLHTVIQLTPKAYGCEEVSPNKLISPCWSRMNAARRDRVDLIRVTVDCA